MNKLISPKITALTFGVLVISFLAAFYVVAWQEPTSAPPAGNVPTPLNTGTGAQTKAGDLTIEGVLKTLQNMIVNLVTIKGDGSISPNLNSDKLDDYDAADLLAGTGSQYQQCYATCDATNSPTCESGWTLVRNFNSGTGCGGSSITNIEIAGMGLYVAHSRIDQFACASDRSTVEVISWYGSGSTPAALGGATCHRSWSTEGCSYGVTSVNYASSCYVCCQ